MIKMVDLYPQYAEIRAELDNSIRKIVHDSAYIKGEEIGELEKNLANRLNVKHCVTCANGTDAITLSLMAIGLERGDEVILPAFSFAAPAEAVILLGGKPVFAEVDSSTFNIDLKSVERLITPRTKAIIAVHLFGQPCDMNALMSMVRHSDIKVIEDNAQSLGSICIMDGNKRQYAGTIGDIGCTSFFPTKPLGAFGDGGAVFTADDDLAERIRALASHGQRYRYTHTYVGINSRIDTVQAAVLLAKLPLLSHWNTMRIEAADRYSESLAYIPEVKIPKKSLFATHIFHQYTIKVSADMRDPLRVFLNKAGIQTMVYYPTALHLQPAYRNICGRDADLSVSENLCDSVLSLPIYSHISGDTQNNIYSHIKNFFKK